MRGTKGVTIVSLIITIIVMLVLIGVTVNTLITSDIIGKTQQAVGIYKNEQKRETSLGLDLIEGYAYTLNETEGYPCTLTKSNGKNLKDYKIYGNSIQSNTPTPSPSNPVPVYSLGEGHNAIEVVSCGKNLLDADTVLIGNGFVKQNDENFYNAVATTVYGKTFFTNMGNDDVVTISYDRKDGSEDPIGVYPYIVYKDNTQVSSSNMVASTDYTHYTFTTDRTKAVNYIKWSYSNINPVWYKNIQIERGTTATEYEPYVEPITTRIDLTGHEPLRKIGDVADYIDYKNSRIVRNIYKVELDGTEQYGKIDQATFAMRLERNLPKGLNNTFSNTNSYCTHVNPDAAFYITWYSNPSNNQFEFRQIVSNWGVANYTVEDWKDFLAEQYANGTPVTVYYQLAEPDDTETIELPQIPTVEGTTVLTASDEYLDSSKICTNYAM